MKPCVSEQLQYYNLLTSETVSYTHLDVYKRQLFLSIYPPHLLCYYKGDSY